MQKKEGEREKLNIRKCVALILTFSMLFASAAVFTPKAQAIIVSYPINYAVEPKPIAPLTDINPSPYGIETPPTPSSTGGEFNVEIHLLNATTTNAPAGVAGLEVKFFFNDTVGSNYTLQYIQPVSYTVYVGTTGGALNSPVLTPIAGFYNSSLIGSAPSPAPYSDAEYFWISSAETDGAAPWNGPDGLVAVITFRIIYQPLGMLGQPAASFPLNLVFTDLETSVPSPIDHGVINGALTIDAAPAVYPPNPYLFVSPATYTGTMGGIFTVAVDVNADAFWDVAGFDITFVYNSTMINLTSVALGGFLTQHGESTYGWITNTTVGTLGEVWAVYTKLSDATPSGGVDSLIVMTFQAIYGTKTFPPPSCDLGLINTDLVSWPRPDRPMAPWSSRITAIDLPYEPYPPTLPWTHYVINGTYTAPFLPVGPAVDVYTQYPTPYGGQGPNEHSDAFAPQMWVWLYAKVTYNGDRVTNKWVTFEVHNAAGAKIAVLSNYSDINGIATVGFRIPQTDLIPGGEDPSIFGWWWVVATAELDQKVVSDNVTFQVGWLVEVLSVTPLNQPYRKYIDSMQFKVTVSTISEQVIPGIVTVDAFDAEGYPIAEGYTPTSFNAIRVEGDPYGTIPGVYTFTYTLPIPTWARVGQGTVTAVVLTDWPRNGGTAYCPTISAPFGISLS
jgi:hypothetical protein